eukprot:6587780-Heterocapsa_arctica.AAC.1
MSCGAGAGTRPTCAGMHGPLAGLRSQPATPAHHLHALACAEARAADGGEPRSWNAGKPRQSRL